MTALLDTLPKPFADRVDKVYPQLKDILGTSIAQQVESSPQRQAEVSISSPSCSKSRWLKAAQEPPAVGTASSLAWISVNDRLSHSDVRSEPQVHRQNHHGDKDAQFQYHLWNLRHEGHDNQEGHSHSPKVPGPKAFQINVCDAHFPRHF
jgi:hypothetical protein